MIRSLSAEWILRNRPNGGTVVVLRALWLSLWGYLAVIILSEVTKPDMAWVFSSEALLRAAVAKAPTAAGIFAAAYAALYARFASQWSYLAGVYNQIMAAKVRGIQQGTAQEDDLHVWQAAFIEDAEDLHLATKPMFAGVVISMLTDDEVRRMFKEGTAGGEARLVALEAKVRKAYDAEALRHTSK